MADLWTVAGCPFQIPIGTGTKPQPCIKILWTVPAARVLINGTPALLATSAGIGQSVEQIPQGPAVVSAVFEAGETSVWLDGAPSYRWSATPAQRMNTIPGGVVSVGGALWEKAAGWQGRIGEIYVFDRALTATELNAVEDYLGAKWQVTMSPS